MDEITEKLTDKQIRFCEEYVVDFNGAQAAIRAGYSEDSAKEQASRLLTNDNISNFISKLQKRLSEKTGITAEKVITELAKIGFSNVLDFIEEGNTVKDLSKIEIKKAAAISSVKKSTTHFGEGKNAGVKEVVEFKLWDKVSALEKLGKHLNIFSEDTKVQATISGRKMRLPDGTEIDL